MRPLRLFLLLTFPLLPTLAAHAALEGSESEYEQVLLDRSREDAHLVPEPKPEGKSIERIVVVPYDVLNFADPWPEFFDVFHTTTRSEVVERELLFTAGQKWSKEIVEESERNLRSNLFLNVAEIRPMKGSSPDKVVALVTTKDLWSLRTNWNFSYVGSKFELVELQFTEANLAGRNKGLGVTFRYDLATLSLGQNYIDPRVLGSRVRAEENASVIWNRSAGKVEGGVFGLTVEKPLYSLATEWAWTASATHRRDVYRLFSAGGIESVTIPETGEKVPFVFHRHVTELKTGVTRSFGREQKENVFFGWRGQLKSYELPNPSAAPVSAASLQAFSARYLPYNERIGMLNAEYRRFRTNYLKLYNVDTFALVEDFREGPDLTFGANLASKAFGFDSDFVEPYFQLAYRALNGDDFFVLEWNASSRYQPQAPRTSPWVNRRTSFGVKNYSPPFSIFRLATGAAVTLRSDDLDHQLSFLGADNGLRGYPTNYFAGSEDYSANVELRTEPWNFHTVYVGGAAFFDVGDTFDPGSGIGAHASVGLGARILFPQFDRAVVRIDFGLPLETVVGADPAYFVAQFGQAF